MEEDRHPSLDQRMSRTAFSNSVIFSFCYVPWRGPRAAMAFKAQPIRTGLEGWTGLPQCVCQTSVNASANTLQDPHSKRRYLTTIHREMQVATLKTRIYLDPRGCFARIICTVTCSITSALPEPMDLNCYNHQDFISVSDSRPRSVVKLACAMNGQARWRLK